MSDDFVNGVEVIESKQHDACNHEINDGPCSANFGFVDDPDIAGDTAS
jgi:hypothetical protein